MKIIASFQTVEHFWRVYDHLIRPNEFKFTTDYHLFKEVRQNSSVPTSSYGRIILRIKQYIDFCHETSHRFTSIAAYSTL